MKNRVVVIFHNFISESNRLYFSNSKRFDYPSVISKGHIFIGCCVLHLAFSCKWSGFCFFFNNNIVKVHITCVRYIQRIGNCISYFRCVFICCLCNRYTLQYVLGSGKNFSDIVYNAQARTSKIIRCYCVFDCCCSCFEWTVNRNIVVTINRQFLCNGLLVVVIVFHNDIGYQSHMTWQIVGYYNIRTVHCCCNYHCIC